MLVRKSESDVKSMVYGAVLAGGVGSRMKCGDLPKQFLPLGDKPVVIYTLEKFLGCEKIERLILGINPDWHGYAVELLKKFGLFEKVHLVLGGVDRSSSLMNVIDFIEENFGISDEDIILTHDAVRPFVNVRILEDNIAAALKYKACGTVVPSKDTPVQSAGGEYIEAMPPRGGLYLSQTPQSFNIKLFADCYGRLTEQQKLELTDATGVFSLVGERVHLVMGDDFNFKITTPFDYKTACALKLTGEI